MGTMVGGKGLTNFGRPRRSGNSAHYSVLCRAASQFGAGSFLPTTLFEWMILAILTLLLMLLGNHLYGRFLGAKH
jgi:hypothetical protein